MTNTWSPRSHTTSTIVSFGIVAACPVLPEPWRGLDFLLVSGGCLPLVRDLRHATTGDRHTRRLLAAAFLALNVGTVIWLFRHAFPVDAATVRTLAGLVGTGASVLVLATALDITAWHRPNDAGAMLDVDAMSTPLPALLGGCVLAPVVAASDHRLTAVHTLVLVLSAVVGGLGCLLVCTRKGTAAVRLLLVALAAVLAGAVSTALLPVHTVAAVTAATLLVVYSPPAPVGPRSPEGAAAGPAVVPGDARTISRLASLAGGLTLVFVVDAAHTLVRGDVEGAVLAVVGTVVTVLMTAHLSRLATKHTREARVLRHHACHDPLTGLPNRREFLDRLAVELRRPYGFLVLFGDLNGFKTVNDHLGHAAGDMVLTEVARRLRHCVREHDTVSRFGGDEFLILYREASPDDEATLVSRIRAALVPPVELDGGAISIAMSIGVVTGYGRPDGSADELADELIRQADEAMYAAKRGRSTTPDPLSHAILTAGAAPCDIRYPAARWQSLITTAPPAASHAAPPRSPAVPPAAP